MEESKFNDLSEFLQSHCQKKNAVALCSSAKRYVDSRSVVKVIDEQGEVIGRLHERIVNYSKNISIMSTTMGGMAQDL